MNFRENPAMRLTDDQIQAIRQTARAVLGEDARVTETDHQVANKATTVGAIYVALIRKLGDRKIDIILKDAATPPALVLEIARQTGIQL
jgi:hypothetical protein